MIIHFANTWNLAVLNGLLQYANLYHANLSHANLYGVIGNGREIKSLNISSLYSIAYTKDRLQIGCKNYSHDAWLSFDDATIAEMGNGALQFWKEYKDLIFTIIERSPAL